MDVQERVSGDRSKLRRLIAKQKDAEQRDRYRAALLAIDGAETIQIAETIGRSRRFVQRWAYAYRDGGIAAIAPKPRPGRKPFLSEHQRRKVAERVRAGATGADGVTVLRGKDLQKWIEAQFGRLYSLSAIYKLLHAPLDTGDFELLSPRPRHPGQDPRKAKQFRRSAPLLSRR
jgi:transposase